MADVNRGNRPLSPHLTIYRPQLTSISSILVRITGNAILVAALLIVWWFLAAATSPRPAERGLPFDSSFETDEFLPAFAESFFEFDCFADFLFVCFAISTI